MAAGPLIGGTVVEGWNGQAIFWTNVPIGLLFVLLVLLALPNSFGARLRADLVGLGVLGLVFGIVRGNPVGWDSFEVVGSLDAGVALGIAVLTAVFTGSGGQLTPTGYVNVATASDLSAAATAGVESSLKTTPHRIRPMRVAIVGAGAVGGTIAALLSRGGHEVTVTARGAQLRTILDHGIELTGAWGDFTARVAASDVLTRSPELAIITTKAQNAEAAMRQNAHCLNGVPVMVVQNGLDALTMAKRVLPDADIVGGLALYAASYLSPGKVAVTTDGVTCVGGPVSGALYVSRVLGAVMPVTLTDNFEGAQWTKLIVNHINALPAITGLSAQEVISHRGLRLIMTESMREAVRAGLARGIDFEKVQGLSDRMLRLLVRFPARIGQLIPLAMKARMGATSNPGSTLQSIRRGQATEIDYLNGAVVTAAVGTDVATPIEQGLVAMVHEVESTGNFLAPAEVVARLA